MTKIIQDYIKLISELYDTTIKPLTPEQNQELEQKLGIYHWEDIKSCIQKYYTRNPKTAPNLTQIMALLETNPKIQQITPEYEEKPIHKPLPTTNIWSIQQTFDKLVTILVDAGVLSDTDGSYHNNKGLIDPKTDLPIINAEQWLIWRVSDAIKERPDLFVKFPNITHLEALAIATQNNLVKFKLRDWEKAAKQLKPEEKTWLKPQDKTSGPKTIGEILGI